MSRRQQLWMLLAVFVIATILRIGLVNRSGLWGDEAFSLAIATGHSLEQPAAVARPELGDFVEPDHPVPPEEFRRYLNHDNPPEGPARVVRAVLLSDTSPPLYYLLLYGWTRLFSTSDIALRAFSIVCSLAIDLLRHTYMVAKPRYAIAGLPAAYLLVTMGLATLRVRPRMLMLLLIVLAWAPHVLSIYRTPAPWLPMPKIAHAASLNSRTSDLILVHSVPSGVLSIARYADGNAPMASWVAQLGNRNVPDSVQSLAAGRTRIVFAKIHDAGAPAPEEDWLRQNAIALQESRLGIGTLVDFRPKDGKTF